MLPAGAQAEALERTCSARDQEVGGLHAALHESQGAQQSLGIQVHLLQERLAVMPTLRTVPLVRHLPPDRDLR